MTVPGWVWLVTVVVILGLLAFDYFFHVRKAHVPTLKEAAIWSSIYVGIAILFGILVWVFGGAHMGSEYFAGYITEKALSVDNLFVFLIIMASFRVPREDQQKVLLFGIVFSLIARTGVHLPRRRADQLVRLGLLLLRPDPADHRRQPARARDTRTRTRRTTSSSGMAEEVLPHHRALRRRQALHHGERQAGPDPDAAGDGGHRRHRHPVRAGLHSRDLRPDPERLHRLHGHRVLADGPAPAVLPDRRPAGPPDLPLLRPGRDPGASSASS